MEALGLLKAQTGSGPNAGAMIVSRPTGGMTMLMRMQVAAHGFPVSDVVQTRLVLESEVMRTLAAQPTVDLSTAVELLDSMDEPSLSSDEFLVLDAQFHVAMADAAGNQVIAAMMAGLRASIESYVVGGVDRIAWPTTCTGCGTSTVAWSRRSATATRPSRSNGSSPTSAATTRACATTPEYPAARRIQVRDVARTRPA